MIGSNKLAELDFICAIPAANASVGSAGERRISAPNRRASGEEIANASARNHVGFNCGALARRDIEGAIRLLESEKDRGVFSLNETFCLRTSTA